jgi:hypothetical protein
MLNSQRAKQKSPRVTWPLGDGTSTLRDPMSQNWILATSAIMELLEGKTKSLPIETFQMFSINTIYESFEPEATGEDTSLALAIQFQSILKDIFKTREITVRADAHQSITSCPWSSVVFTQGSRRCGLHFLLKEPFFEMFMEPNGPTPEKKPSQVQEQPRYQFQNPLDILDAMTGVQTTTTAPANDGYHSKFGKRWT